MLSPVTRALLVGALIAVPALALVFSRRQNKGAMGGAMSKPKVFWLLWAVLAWFFVAPIVAFDPAVSRPLRLVLAAFGVWMWIRGVAELLLLYVFKAWRPPMGIAHDVSCIAILAVGLMIADGPFAGFDAWVRALCAVLLVSLCVEIMHAAMFFRAVEGRTTGHEGIWFADETDPRFRRINRLTFAFNVPLYAFLAAFVLRGFFQ